jgi:hypothetical protein
MLKHYFSFVVIFAFCITFFTSCKKEITPSTGQQVAVNLLGNINPGAIQNVANDQWDANDVVGLYMKAAGQSLTTAGSVYPGAANVQMSIVNQ